MFRRHVLAVLCAGLLFALPKSATAATIGFYSNNAAGTPSAAITASGNTPVALANLTAGDLAGLQVLWILNGINGTPDATIMNNLAAISAFVAGGGVLSFHDRNVSQGVSAATYIPGAAGVTFVSELGAEITVLTSNGVTNGPAGVIGQTTLDGGNFSDHGYALEATLPVGAVGVLSTLDRTHIVDFYYQFGLGWVYYSTIPMDFYFAGGGNNPPGDAFRFIYGPNEAGFQASLAGQAVPEPGTVLLLGGGLALLATRLRRRRA